MNRKRKERDQIRMQIGDSGRNIVTGASDIKQRWKEHFEWLLNVDDGRRAELTDSGLRVMHALEMESLRLAWNMLERL